MGIITNFLAEAPVNDRTLTLTDPQAVTFFGGARTFSGLNISPTKAMRCATVLACIRTIIDDLATMGQDLYERTLQDGSVYTNPALNEPLYPILKETPNEEMTSQELVSANMWDIFANGEFYNQVLRVDGEVQSIWPLCSSGITKRRKTDGELYFSYSSAEGTKTFRKEEIWRGQRLPFLAFKNGLDGQSLMLLMREAIGTLLAAEMQSGRLFSSGAQVNSVLKVPPEVDLPAGEDQKVLDNFNEKFTGVGNSMKTALLPYGISLEKIALTADEAQHIERQKATTEDIVRGFGGGALMVRLGVGEKVATYSSSLAFLDDYYRSVLRPYTKMFESTAVRDLLLPSERGRLYVKMNKLSLLGKL